MDLQHHRKLLADSIISTFCKPICYITAYCEPACLTYCPTNCSCTDKCLSVMFYDNPAPSPPIYQDDSQKPNRAPKLLVTSLVVLCAVFLVVCFCAVYYRFYGNRRTRQQPISQTHDDFLDEDHQGPILDHPIWYIRTTGLQPSIISSITVLKYKKGEGIVDGTDCSVCLTEFQEDDTVRLLPKCSHAFHVSCIDTWLRSHTNCPLCRAPIVTSSTIRTTTPVQTSVLNSGSVEEREVEFADNSGESNNREIDNGASGLRVTEEGEATVESGRNIGIEVQSRRSVSLDSLSAAKINIDLRNGFHLEKDEKLNGAREGNAATSSGSSHSSAGKARFKGSSSMSRTSSNGAGSMKRSFSWSGIILSSRHSRNQKTKAAVRSF